MQLWSQQTKKGRMHISTHRTGSFFFNYFRLIGYRGFVRTAEQVKLVTTTTGENEELDNGSLRLQHSQHIVS